MAFQFANIVSVQEYFRGVHGQFGREVGVVSAGALGDVLSPGVVVEAVAARGAAHLAVAGVVVAAVTEGEAVGGVAAEEVERRSLHQRGEAQLPTVGQLAVDTLQVCYQGQALSSIKH